MKLEKPDFRVGDKVYCLAGGNGRISEIDLDENYPIKVDFGFDDVGEKCIDEYTIYGHLYNEYDHNKPRRTLFHGHDLIVTVQSIKPKRTKIVWANLYNNKVNKAVSCFYYDSIEEADAHQSTKRLRCVKLEIPV